MQVQAYDLEPDSRFEWQGDVFDVVDFDEDSDKLIVQRRNATQIEKFDPRAKVTVIH